MRHRLKPVLLGNSTTFELTARFGGADGPGGATGTQTAPQKAVPTDSLENWNYFNYFTEIEEHFWKKRGAHLLVSPLDWAIMETWQKAGVPLEAALKGIDQAFESYGRSRRSAGKPLKSLAYCTDAVLQAAEEGLEAAAGSAPKNGREAKEPFPREELKAYLARNAGQVAAAAKRDEGQRPEMGARLAEIAESVRAGTLLLDSPAKV